MTSSVRTGGILSRQPFKGLYVLFAIALNAAKLPWWLIRYLPRAFRQHPSFTYAQAIGTEIVRNFTHVITVVRISTPLQLAPGPDVKDRARYVRFEPSTVKTAAPEGGRYTGVVSISPETQPTASYGIWYPSCPSKDALERLKVDEKAPPLILHFHGGAFVIGEPRPNYLGYLGNLLSSELGPTLCASYRLASNPNGAFPAALQDAVTAYSHVLSAMSIPARRVVLSGDSAGGNLVLALLRYIARFPEAGLESPGAALLWSPWLDVSAALDYQLLSSSPYKNTDYLPYNFISWGATSISHNNSATPQRQSEAAVDGPWVSPGRHPFGTATPVWVQASGLEVLHDDIAAFVPKMQGIKSNDIELYVEPVANHDIVLTANITGFGQEAARSVKEAKSWLSSKLQQ